jgi:acyl-coenzyme A thioesterase PaaI-like protein
MDLREIENDCAVFRLSFSEAVVTIGDIVHGSAVSALIDTAAMTASWSVDRVRRRATRGFPSA